MQMINHLASRPPGIHLNSPAALYTPLMCHLPRCQEQLTGQFRIIKIIQTHDMLLRHYQNMHPRLGVNIVKSSDLIAMPNQFILVTIGN